MKRTAKLACSLALTVAVAVGTVLSGCAESTNYTEEIKRYQEKLEALEAENQELKDLLGMEETEDGAETESESETETDSETAETEPEETQSAAEDESQADETDDTQAAGEQTEDNVVRMLVFGDSIWDNYRDETGIAAKVEHYMAVMGYETKVYNAAIGGTRATIDPDDNEWEYGAASDDSLGKMVSILNGQTDIELLQGKAAYAELAEAMTMLNDIDVVILAYGMNDFLAEAPGNDSDRSWTGFGTALVRGVQEVRKACPNAEVLLVAPTYAAYFPIPIDNVGETALYNFAYRVYDVARGSETLCVDGYYNMGINVYNYEEYLEDGIHLNEKGRDLYARHVVSCLFGGEKGKVSGNTIYDFDAIAGGAEYGVQESRF